MPRFSKLNGKQSRTSHSIKLCITMIAINNSRLITLWYFLLITCVLFERKTVILMIVTSGIWLTQWGLGGRQLFALILHSAGQEIYVILLWHLICIVNKIVFVFFYLPPIVIFEKCYVAIVPSKCWTTLKWIHLFELTHVWWVECIEACSDMGYRQCTMTGPYPSQIIQWDH